MADDGAHTWEANDTLTDAEFARMAANGAFQGLGRWELRRGKLHRMSPTYHPHARAQTLLVRFLAAAVEAVDRRLEVTVDASVAFGGGFTPVPDIVVCEGAHAGFVPGGAVRLVVEVADATLAEDLGAKSLDYARAGLAEYIVADLTARRLVQRTEPTPEGFAAEAVIPFGALLTLKTLPGVTIETVRLAEL